MTIYDIFKSDNNWIRHDGIYGIEIETETLEPYQWPSLNYWECDRDYSLRNQGVEYICKQPVSGMDLIKALEEFSDLDYPFIQDSLSTSVHVHRNVLNEHPIIVANVLMVYALLEPVLCRYMGPDREFNLFCLQLKDAENGIENILKVIRYLGKTDNNRGRDPHYMKYSALNLSPFWEYGSIEFRGLYGTTDTDKIQEWINIIECLFEYASTMDNPLSILEDFRLNMSDMLDNIFKDHAETLEYDEWMSDVEGNVFYGWRIATEVDDWKDFGHFELVVLSREIYNKIIEKTAEVYFGGIDSSYIRNLALNKYLNKVQAGGNVYGEHYIWEDDVEEFKAIITQEPAPSPPETPDEELDALIAELTNREELLETF